jgi:hypothetical protein
MRSFILVLLACAAIAACGNPNGLPPAYITNKVDSLVSLYALSGTPVSLPSGYSLISDHTVRTDQGSPFDFAFDIDSAGTARLYPTGALKLGRASGMLLSAQQFDSIKIAPTSTYNLDSSQVVSVNTVLILHSSSVSCSYGIPAFYYAKLHVLTIDTTSSVRRIDFEILTNLNCGYRGLEPGVPRQ